MNIEKYPFEIRPLSGDEGGGYLITFPDFNVCMSDGETVEEAIANGRDALRATIAALRNGGFPIPEPNSGGTASGKFVIRMPKSLHAKLAARARLECVSLNTMALSFIAAGIGQQDIERLPAQSPTRRRRHPAAA
jgi:antitoxin HicB